MDFLLDPNIAYLILLGAVLLAMMHLYTCLIMTLGMHGAD